MKKDKQPDRVQATTKLQRGVRTPEEKGSTPKQHEEAARRARIFTRGREVSKGAWGQQTRRTRQGARNSDGASKKNKARKTTQRRERITEAWGIRGEQLRHVGHGGGREKKNSACRTTRIESVDETQEVHPRRERKTCRRRKKDPTSRTN